MDEKYSLAKGGLYIISSYILFYLSGYLIQFGLTRIISPQTYGTIGVIITILSIFQIFLTGIPTAAAKFLSEGIDGNEIMKKTIFLQSIYTICIALILAILSPAIATLLNDKTYIPYLLVLSLMILIRGISLLFDSFFNGYRELSKQSILLLIDSVPKLFFVLFFVYVGYEIYGVLVGYALTSLIGILYGVFFFKPRKTSLPISYIKLIHFSSPLIVFAVLFQLLSAIDLLILKSSNIPSEYIGFYTSARVLSTIFIIFGAAFSIIVFPSIAKANSERDGEKVNFYITNALRYLILLFLPISIIVSIYSRELLSFFFTQKYSQAASSLSLLIWAWAFLQIFFVLANILNAVGKSKIPVFICSVLVIAAYFLNSHLIKIYGIDGAALTTLICSIISVFIGLYYIKILFHNRYNFFSLTKIIFASLIVLSLSFIVHLNGILLVFWCIILFAIYFLILFFIHEITFVEIAFIKMLYKSLIQNSKSSK